MAEPFIGYKKGRIEGTQRGWVWGGSMPPLHKNFEVVKLKMAHFCALLSIDFHHFKVCRLITETVSDHSRK